MKNCPSRWLLIIVACYIIQYCLTNSSLVYAKFVMKTVGGGGVCDGYDATASSVSSPIGSCVLNTNTSELYFADSAHHRIRKILNNGIIVTVVGDGAAGDVGDFILDATQARLNSPQGIVFNSLGELYIADKSNHDIHLDQPELVIQAVQDVMSQVE